MSWLIIFSRSCSQHRLPFCAGAKAVEVQVPPLSQQLQLDDLWDALSVCLTSLARMPDSHAVLVLQPTVEAFFLVHAGMTDVLFRFYRCFNGRLFSSSTCSCGEPWGGSGTDSEWAEFLVVTHTTLSAHKRTQSTDPS